MNPFRAIAIMFNGFMNIFFKDWALSNPDAAYEGIIQSKLQEREKILEDVGAVRGQYNESKRNLTTAERELVGIERDILGAKRTRNVTLGAALLQQREAKVLQVAQYREENERLKGYMEDLMATTQRFNSDLIGITGRRKTNVARWRSSRAMAAIDDRMAGLAINTDDQMLEKLEEGIEAEIGAAEVRHELNTLANIDLQVAKAKAAASQSGYEAEFEEMIRQQDAAQNTHAAQTPPADTGGKQA